MCIYIYTWEQPHLCTEKNSRLQGTVFWGPEVALLANEIGTDHRTRSIQVMYHTSSLSKLGLDGTRSVKTSKITSKIRNEANEIRNRTLKCNIRLL